MATYCFQDARELFTEAALRGFLEAVADFPHKKSEREQEAAERAVSDELRGEVCCIDDEARYQRLVERAWAGAYRATQETTERELAQLKMVLKCLGMEDSKALVRAHFVEATVNEAYAQFVALYK